MLEQRGCHIRHISAVVDNENRLPFANAVVFVLAAESSLLVIWLAGQKTVNRL